MAGVQSTSQQRRNYAPACKAKGSLFIPAYQARDFIFKRHNYRCNRSYTGCYSCRPITGGSDYSLHAFGPGDRFIHWDGTPCGATSLAEDVNAAQNPYGPRLVTDRPPQMQREIDTIKTKSGAKVWGWGGYYKNNKDAMHDEIVCTLQDLMSGIDWSTVAGWEDDSEENELNEDEKTRLKTIERAVTSRGEVIVYVDYITGKKHHYVRQGFVAKHIPDGDTLNLLVGAGFPVLNNNGEGYSHPHTGWIAFLDGPLKNI